MIKYPQFEAFRCSAMYWHHHLLKGLPSTNLPVDFCKSLTRDKAENFL